MQWVSTVIGVAITICTTIREQILASAYEFQVGLLTFQSAKRRAPSLVYVYVEPELHVRR